MRLYNVVPKSSRFSWPNDQGKRRPVPMTGIWLGSPGREYRHAFVPVVAGPDEPDEAAWGIGNSRTFRPKIKSNHDQSEGWIATLSSYTGKSHIVGHVLVREDHLDNLVVIEFGIGGSEELGTRYHEYLVQISGECEFILRNTLAPDKRVLFISDDVFEVDDISNPSGYVSLDDVNVRRWSRENGES